MKKIPVWKNIVLIISFLVVIIIATFAWFYTGPYATVYDLTVDMGKASYIQISGDEGENWSEDLTVDIGINRKFKEISGNGTTLFAPVYDTVENAASGLSTQIVAFDKVDGDTRYYEQIFAFRADTEHDIYLTPESCVQAVADSRDSYIDGAIRVAFFELDENDNETLKCIWAPNSKVEYSAATDSFTRDGNVEPNYYYQKTVTPVDAGSLEDGVANSHLAKISTAHPEGFAGCAHCGYNAAYNFMWSCGEDLPENAPSLLRVDGTDGEGLYCKRMKIKVWLEGYDRECVSQLSGQKFTMKLQFSTERGE